MGSYDNTDISYKAAGAETYHLPILYNVILTYLLGIILTVV